MRIFAVAVFLVAVSTVVAADVRPGVRALLAGREDEAIELLTPDAQRGDAEGQYFLADALRRQLNARSGVIVAGDEADPAQQQIHRWLEKAARQGHVPAMSVYALDLDSGYGTPPDFPAALEWMQKSAAFPDSPARTHLSIWYGTGHIVAPDRVKADALAARPAASRGGQAQREVLELPQDSQPPIDPAAMSRDLADVEAGNSMAAMRLAKAALRSARGERDCGSALRWYQRAGELGNPDGFESLGDAHYFGSCGKQDLSRAHADFTRGADLASAYSLQRLAAIEMFGQGRTADLTSAYFRLLLARGLSDANFNHGDAMLRFARARLTPSQRQAAEARSAARLGPLRAIQAQWREQITTRREVAAGRDTASPSGWSYSILRVDDQGHCVSNPPDCERSLTKTEVRIRNNLATPLECTFTAPTPRNWTPPPPDIVRQWQIPPSADYVSTIVEESFEMKMMPEDAAGARIACTLSARLR